MFTSVALSELGYASIAWQLFHDGHVIMAGCALVFGVSFAMITWCAYTMMRLYDDISKLHEP